VSTTSPSPKITECAVVVPPPDNVTVLEQMGLPAKAKAIADLQMRSSSREIPDPLEHWEHPANLKLKPEGWWLSENASFTGQASAINSYKEVSAPSETALSGATAAFCVTTDGRLLGIISPNGRDEASVWISTSCARIQAAAASSAKASALTISGDGWTVQLSSVDRLHRHVKSGGSAVKTGAKLAAFAAADILILPSGGKRSSEVEGRFETNQTPSFVDAIRNGSSVSSRFEFVKPDGPPLGQGYRWIADPGLGGVYRLERKGEPTTATFLVDRELPRDAQLAALDAIGWAPRAMVDWVRKRVEDESEPKLSRPELPAGRVSHPFWLNSLGLNVGDGPQTHPVARYLWPSLSGGEPSLDADEQVLHEYRSPHVHLSAPGSAEQPSSSSEIGTGKTGAVRIFVTNQRLIVVAARSQDAVQDGTEWWVSHFRHEWIYEIGTEAKKKVKVKMLSLKPKPGTETHETAAYVRMRQSGVTVHELMFPEFADASFITDLLAALTATPGRSVSDANYHHNYPVIGLVGVEVDRTAKVISGAVPYSLPLGLASDR
jgi:hypothetical protein